MLATCKGRTSVVNDSAAHAAVLLERWLQRWELCDAFEGSLEEPTLEGGLVAEGT